jgi:myosin heavy subunit
MDSELNGDNMDLANLLPTEIHDASMKSVKSELDAGCLEQIDLVIDGAGCLEQTVPANVAGCSETAEREVKGNNGVGYACDILDVVVRGARTGIKLKKKLVEKKADNRRLANSLEEKTNELAKKITRISELEESCAEMLKEREECAKCSKARIGELEADVSSCRANIQRLEKELSHTRQSLQTTECKYSRAKAESAELQTAKSELVKKCAEEKEHAVKMARQHNVENHEYDIIKLKTEILRYKGDLFRARDEKEDLQVRYNALVQTHSTMRDQNSKLMRDNKCLRKEQSQKIASV